jgi:hypothetical protein
MACSNQTQMHVSRLAAGKDSIDENIERVASALVLSISIG